MIITRTREVKLPTRGTKGSAGLDFYVPNDFNDGQIVVLQPHQDILIPSGIRMIVPEDHMLVFENKSGVSTKQRLEVGACVVDEDYRGEVHLHVYNTGQGVVKIEPGQKLVQGVLLQVNKDLVLEISEHEFENMSRLEDLERGTGGFGSTGLY